MSTRPMMPVQQEVARAGRRLFLQTLLNRLSWSWAGALFLAAVWFLVQPFVTGGVDDTLRWSVTGGLVGAATLLALVLAWRHAPGSLAVALEVDQRLGLAERVTTTLTLSEADTRSPAGQALLADVHKTLTPLNVRSRFPVRLSCWAALVPACGIVLGLLAWLYEPAVGTVTGNPPIDPQAQAEANQIDQKLRGLKKKQAGDWPKDQLDKAKLEEINALWDKLLKEKLDLNDKEKVRERVQALRDLEEKMKDRAQDLKGQVEKGQNLKQQLQKLASLDPKGQKPQPKDGPGKELEDALAKGQFDKAQKELEALQKKLEEKKLDEKQLQQLQDQLQDLKNKLQRLADQKERKDQLQRQKDLGEIDEEQMKQALEQMEQEGADLEELAKLLDECKDCLGKGKNGKASGKLKGIVDKLKEIELDEKDLKELEENEEALKDAREAILAKMNGGGLQGGGPPGGKRPMGAEKPVQSHDARQRADTDPRGQLKVTGFGRGGTFSKIPAKEVQGAFRQAVQDAPEAIERQRVSPEAAEMLKGYYENLGGQRRK